MKSLWVDFQRSSLLLFSVLHVCSSKDTDGGTLLLFDLTCAVFLMRTTLGREAVFGLESNCKHHIKAFFIFLPLPPILGALASRANRCVPATPATIKVERELRPADSEDVRLQPLACLASDIRCSRKLSGGARGSIPRKLLNYKVFTAAGRD